MVEKSTGPVTRKLSPMRKAIAHRMAGSLALTAQATVCMEIDATGLLFRYRQVKERYPEERLTLTVAFVKAAALAVERLPIFKCRIEGEDLIEAPEVNIGLAVALDNGLVVPVIKTPGNKGLRDLAREVHDVVARVRAKRFTEEDLQGGVFTVTNLGMYGVSYFTPILNYPESAILGIGSLKQVPVYEGEELRRKEIIPLSLTHDHRLIDGAVAAQFMHTFKALLENEVTWE
ncbi:2-oxo acid dehydrogenase subunit E2 [Moorellaceae bacterium AZ2]